MLDLVDAERVTIFALDTKNQELFSLFKAGQEVKEIRVPKTFGSIAGFTALSRKTANIKNAYDPAELTRLHPNLQVRLALGQGLGLPHQPGPGLPDPLREVPAGRAAAHQQARRRRLHAQGRGGRRGAGARSWASPSTTSTAPRAATSPPSSALLVDKGLVSEKDIENAVSNARGSTRSTWPRS